LGIYPSFVVWPWQRTGRSATPDAIEVHLIRNPDHAKKLEKEERESCRLFCNGFLRHFVWGSTYLLILGRTESKVEARKGEEATDECRRHDVQSTMCVVLYTDNSTDAIPLTPATSYRSSFSKHNQRQE